MTSRSRKHGLGNRPASALAISWARLKEVHQTAAPASTLLLACVAALILAHSLI